jgi:hypothetical protein
MKEPRRRIHRAFARWLKANRTRFRIPLRIFQRTDRALYFSFDHVSHIVTGCLSTWEIIVEVQFENTSWDLIFVAEQSAERVPDGYICRLCLPEFIKVFTNRDALWTGHLFEPLLTWVNDELSPANWLVLEGRAEHSTVARLAAERPVEPLAADPKWPLTVVPLKSPTEPGARRRIPTAWTTIYIK